MFITDGVKVERSQKETKLKITEGNKRGSKISK